MSRTGPHEQVAALIGRKLNYEGLKIPEYWIVDYLGIGGKYYLGSPKQPTVTICRLVNDIYEKVLLRRGDVILSSLFPNLQLNTEQLFAFGDRT